MAIDLPGFGLSGPPRLPQLSAYADNVVEGLRALAVPAGTVVRHSLGGAVAAAVAERFADRIVSLVLCAPAGLRPAATG